MDNGLLGGDLGSILSQMQAYSQPTPEEQAAARRQQLAIMFASLIGAPKGMEWDRLGQGAMLGMQARGQALGGASENRRKAMQDAAAALQLQNALQGQRSAQQERQIWSGGPGMLGVPAPVSGPPAAFQSPGGASALMGGAMGEATPPTANLPTQTAGPSSTRDAMRAYLQSVIANAQKAGRGDIVQAASQQLLKLEPPPDEVFKVDYANDASGKPTTFVVFKSGRSATIPGIVPREKIDYLNTGGAFLPKGEYSGVIPGAAPIQATMTPDAVAANQVALGNLGVARGNLNVAQQRLGLEQQAAQAGPKPNIEIITDQSGNRLAYDKNNPTVPPVPIKTAEGVPVGAPPEKTTDVQERAAVSSSTMENANNTLNRLAKEGFTGSGITGGGVTSALAGWKGIPLTPAGPVANIIGSGLSEIGSGGKADQFLQARDQFVMGVQLYQARSGSGTQMSREQIMSAFIPSLTDSKETRKQKEDARANIIANIRNAARSASTTTARPAGSIREQADAILKRGR